ncbi:MAG TPA: hypothetical protein VMU37_06475, partial [Caulobacteraceae bacterium]|nr:hypothetical protein [Caulobacteraceae bacterium]
EAQGLADGLAMDVARVDPLVARRAAEYLEEQTRILKLQAAEYPLRMSHLRSQSREGKIRRTGQRIRIGMQVFVALVAALIGFGLLVMLHDAFNSKAVIVDPFDAPPDLAARGLTGKMIAGGVLDALTRLQAATQSTSAKRNLSNAWTGDIKVEVPDTGVSIGDIDRMLKMRFGHDIHIDGDLIQTEIGGLALTIRGDGVLPRTFVGGAGDLDKLTTQAAEYVYGLSEPSLFANYLSGAGRNAEAVTFSKAAYATDRKADRPYLLNEWSDALQNIGAAPGQSLPLLQEALKLKPDFWIAYNNIENIDLLLGDEEGAWRLGDAMREAAGGRPGRAPELYYENWDLVTWNLSAWRKATVADSDANAGIGTGDFADAPEIADIDVRLHDPVDAEIRLQTA